MDTPNGKPLVNKILIKHRPKKEKTASGLIIADVALNPLVEADVISVSDNITTVTAGDSILIPNGAGVPHEFSGINYYFIQESDPFYLL